MSIPTRRNLGGCDISSYISSSTPTPPDRPLANRWHPRVIPHPLPNQRATDPYTTPIPAAPLSASLGRRWALVVHGKSTRVRWAGTCYMSLRSIIIVISMTWCTCCSAAVAWCAFACVYFYGVVPPPPAAADSGVVAS